MQHSALAVLAVACCCAAFAQNSPTPAAVESDPQFKAGGVLLTLPGPTNDFPEVGDRLRTTVFDLLAPSTNRLLSAYVPARKLAELKDGKTTGGLDSYALVEVARGAEYQDCTPQAFEEVLKSVGPAMSKFEAEGAGQVGEEMNIRLKSLGAKPIEIGHPEMLGSIFKKTDAFAFAMLVALKQDERSVTMAGGFAALRLKQRLVFAYLFRNYDSPETVLTLDKDLEIWVDAILAKNK